MDTILQPTTAADERQRLESFRMRGPHPSPAGGPPKHAHRRSHSRNGSISSSVSSLSLSSSTNSLVLPPTKSMNFNDISPSLSPSPSTVVANNKPAAGNKRNSHHRRRSSVSTRHESAELMGVAVPDLPPSSSSDNINLGEKDSIRRRALLALEGKTDHYFSKVEIPELTTPVLEQKQFDLGGRGSFGMPSGSGNSFGANSLTPSNSKRDSFKMLASSSSSKDLLGTLVEEEEEEEETPARASAPDIPVSAEPPVRHRPAGLSLRPLSLASKNALNNMGLPTPSSPNPRTGLRSLALATSPLIPSHASADSDDLPMKPYCVPSSISSPSVLFRRSSLSSNSDSEDCKPLRRSSISYKPSAGLPTPEMTPTFDRRFSGDTLNEEPIAVRRLSVSEQHFLFKQHNALLARITDLEKALTYRPRSRPQSNISDVSSVADSSLGSTEPNDEMLQLIADLKAERDELKRDVDGWRCRISDMEKQSSLLAHRLEAERREAWVARSRVGLLEVEKTALQKSLDGHAQQSTLSQQQYLELESKYSDLQSSLTQVTEAGEERVKDAETEVSRLITELAAEKLKVADLERELAAAKAGSVVKTPSKQFSSGRGGYLSEDEDDPLAGYEDEDDVDAYYQSGSDDSFSSPRKISSIAPPALSRSRSGSPTEGPTSPLNVPVTISAPQVVPGHAPHATLSKTWTFPKVVDRQAASMHNDDVDHFFGCFGGDDDSNASLSPVSSYETSKDTFTMGFKLRSKYFVDSDEEEEEEDGLPPFMLPSNVGIAVQTPSVISSQSTQLDAVKEEEEEEALSTAQDDDDDVFGEIGGITFTFTPPESEDQLVVPASPMLETTVSLAEEAAAVIVTPPPSPQVVKAEVQPRSASPSGIPRPVKFSTRSSSPTSSSPTSLRNSPSSIPRAVSFKSFPLDSPKVTPPRLYTTQFSPPSPTTFVTPPTKRGGTTTTTTFIPHLASSPSPSTPSKVVVKPLSTFIRQPTRKTPLLPTNGRTSAPNDKQVSMKNISHPRRFDVVDEDRDDYDELLSRKHPPRSTIMESIDLTNQPLTTRQASPGDCNTSSSSPHASGTLSSFVSNSFSSTRLSSLQSFTSLIPLSWPAFDDHASSSASAISHQFAVAEKERTAPKYTSRDQQLEKLRLQLRNDGHDYYATRQIQAIDSSCKKCKGGIVRL